MWSVSYKITPKCKNVKMILRNNTHSKFCVSYEDV